MLPCHSQVAFRHRPQSEDVCEHQTKVDVTVPHLLTATNSSMTFFHICIQLDTSLLKIRVKEEKKRAVGLCRFATVSLASGHTRNSVLSPSEKTKYWQGRVQSLVLSFCVRYS